MYFFIISIIISGGLCDFFGVSAVMPKETRIDPNAFPKNIYKSKNGHNETPFGFESNRIGNDLSRPVNSAENSLRVNLSVRRFVNLLLKRAHFKDFEGNTVALESISNPQFGELSMSISLVANPSELVILREFGLKRNNLTVGQIDELLSNLFSADPPPQPWNNDCKIWSWDEFLDVILKKIDAMKVLHIGICLCLIWIMISVAHGRSHWKMIIFALLLASVGVEVIRMYEEETQKQYSEQLRLGKTPEHCLGTDNRSWWKKLWAGDSAEECLQYHLHKNSNPALKVSYTKAVLSQVQMVVDLNVNTLRKLIAGYDDRWFFTNTIYQIIICATIGFCVIALLAMKCGGVIRLPFFLTIKGDREPVQIGSKVQSLPSEDSQTMEPVQPPPRRKNANKKKISSVSHHDGDTSTSRIIYIKSKVIHLNAAGTSKCENLLQDADSLDQDKKKSCHLCGSINENGESTEGKSNTCKEENVVKSEECIKKIENGPEDKPCDTYVQNPKCDVLAGGNI